MVSYIIRRLFLMVPTLVGVLAVVFFIMAFAPGGFGGREMTQEGAQTEGYDARRYLKQQQRRYGLNLPIAAQFGRWMNQVSPVGFRMSSDIQFTDAQREAVAGRLADAAFNTRQALLDRAVDLALSIAAYKAIEPTDAADRLLDALEAPSQTGMELFDWMDVALQPGLAEQLQADIARQMDQRGLAAAQNKLISELSFEVSGLSRVRFDRLALKPPDLGRTMKGRPVLDRITETLPITVLLNVITIPIIYLVAIVVGVYAARHRNSWFDISSGFTFLGLWSIPVIWSGVMLIKYLANEDVIRIFPATGLHDLRAETMAFLPQWTAEGFERGWLLDMAWHLVLPIICLTYGGFAVMSKVMRGAMLDNLSADFVRTARAKGLPERVVLWQHVFRNGILPLITMAASIVPALFVGSVVVETLFAINGMGRLGVEAAFQKDRDLVMATTLVAAILKLLSELIRDVCYAVADPRVSYD